MVVGGAVKEIPNIIGILVKILFMATAGYSGTPLIKKLGLKPSYKVWLIHPPDGYSQWLGEDISPQLCSSRETPDWVHLFAASASILHKEMTRLRVVYEKNTQLVIWVS